MALRYYTPSRQEYVSTYVPLPFDAIEKSLAMRQGEYDATKEMIIGAEDKFGGRKVDTSDINTKNELISSYFGDIDKMVSEKYGNDYGRAFSDVAGRVTKFNRDPFWIASEQKLARQEKYRDVQTQYGTDAIMTDPNILDAPLTKDNKGNWQIPNYEGSIFKRNDYDKWVDTGIGAKLQKHFWDTLPRDTKDPRFLAQYKTTGYPPEKIAAEITPDVIKQFIDANPTWKIEHPENTEQLAKDYIVRQVKMNVDSSTDIAPISNPDYLEGLRQDREKPTTQVGRTRQMVSGLTGDWRAEDSISDKPFKMGKEDIADTSSGGIYPSVTDVFGGNNPTPVVNTGAREKNIKNYNATVNYARLLNKLPDFATPTDEQISFAKKAVSEANSDNKLLWIDVYTPTNQLEFNKLAHSKAYIANSSYMVLDDGGNVVPIDKVKVASMAKIRSNKLFAPTDNSTKVDEPTEVGVETSGIISDNGMVIELKGRDNRTYRLIEQKDSRDVSTPYKIHSQFKNPDVLRDGRTDFVDLGNEHKAQALLGLRIGKDGKWEYYIRGYQVKSRSESGTDDYNFMTPDNDPKTGFYTYLEQNNIR